LTDLVRNRMRGWGRVKGGEGEDQFGFDEGKVATRRVEQNRRRRERRTMELRFWASRIKLVRSKEQEMGRLVKRKD